MLVQGGEGREEMAGLAGGRASRQAGRQETYAQSDDQAETEDRTGTICRLGDELMGTR